MIIKSFAFVEKKNMQIIRKLQMKAKMLNIVSEVQLVWEMMSKYFAVAEDLCCCRKKYANDQVNTAKS